MYLRQNRLRGPIPSALMNRLVVHAMVQTKYGLSLEYREREEERRCGGGLKISVD